MKHSVQIVADSAAVARAAAEVWVGRAVKTVAAHGRFTVALSGGSTPKALYSILASDAALRDRMPWDKTFFFFGDERHVPPDNPDSNYKTANDGLFTKLGIDSSRVFRIKSEAPDADRVAREYEDDLRKFFTLNPGELPRLDLVFLGMGPDGHCASLFPGTKALHETSRLVTSNWVGKFFTHRITMTAPVLNNAACVLFMVAGADKAQPLKAVLEGPHEPEQLPSQLVQPVNGSLLWLVDQSAAAQLDRGNSKFQIVAA